MEVNREEQQPGNQQPLAEEQDSAEQELVAITGHATDSEDESEPGLDEAVSYRELTKEQLLNEYRQLAETDMTEILTVKNKIAAVEDAFKLLLQHERQHETEVENEQDEATGEEEDTKRKKHDPLADQFFEFQKIIRNKKNDFNNAQEREREQNLVIKRELLENLKSIIQNEEDLQKAFNAFHEIRDKWSNTGIVPFNEAQDIQLNYRHLVNKFYEFIKINRELQELDWKKNLELKIKICEEAEALHFESSVKTALDKLTMLNMRWHEAGPVARDKKTEIFERFKAAADAIHKKRKEQIEQLKLQWADNEAKKNELIDQVAKIEIPEPATSANWRKINEELEAIQSAWKHTGRTEKVKNDELWERFRAASEVIYKKRKEFYSDRRKEYQINLQKKNDICSRAEALLNSIDLKSASADMRKLTEEWKQTGHVPGKFADKIWERFRKAKDSLYEKRKSFFAEAEKQFEDNLEKKTGLIERIESFELTGNNKEDFEQLRGFQYEWSEIGMVPAAKKNEVYERYKKAIDSLFDKLRISEKERSVLRFKDRIDHLKTSADGKSKMREEERVLHNKISHLKSEVNTLENNIGFFAKSKNADQIKKDFEDKILKAKNELEKLRKQLEMIKSAK